MKSITLARLKNFIELNKSKKNSTITKYVKGVVYTVTDSEAQRLLAKTNGRDVPVFKEVAPVEEKESQRPQTKSLTKRQPKALRNTSKTEEVTGSDQVEV